MSNDHDVEMLRAMAKGVFSNDMKPAALDSMNRLRVQAEREKHQLRGALLWLLWHHQGASSVVGLACRRALGIGQYDRLTKSQVEDAEQWDAESNAGGPEHG